MKTRVLVVDDHTLFRDGLRAVLSAAGDIELVGEAADARQALQKAEELKPDVVLLDVGLPGSNGLAVIRDLLRTSPDSRILVLTMHSAQENVLRAFQAGALGYALKDQPADEVLLALRSVARGIRYLAPNMPAWLLEAPKHGAPIGPLGALSPREHEIFDLAVRGFSNVSIAAQLHISLKTVETHRAKINRKLGVHSAAELIRFAARNGLVTD